MSRLPLVVLVTVLGCASRPPAPHEAPPDVAMLRPPENALLTDAGQLQVFTTNLLSDGRRMRVRGFVHNPYREPIDGVRLALRLLSHADADGEELDRFQRVQEGTIAPGQDAAVHWDIESGYAAVDGGSFELQAFAIRRGERALGPPPGWRR